MVEKTNKRVPKRKLTPPQRPHKYPKIEAHERSKKLNEAMDEYKAQAIREKATDIEEVPEVPLSLNSKDPKASEAPKTPEPLDGMISITIEGGKAHINCGPFTLVRTIAELSQAHKFLMAELMKGLALNENTGSNDGAPDSTS